MWLFPRTRQEEGASMTEHRIGTQEEWQAERHKVETNGWGAQLLAHQDPDGQS